MHNLSKKNAFRNNINCKLQNIKIYSVSFCEILATNLPSVNRAFEHHRIRNCTGAYNQYSSKKLLLTAEQSL